MDDTHKQSTLNTVHSLTQFSDAKAGALITLLTVALTYFFPAASESMRAYQADTCWLGLWKILLLLSAFLALAAITLSVLSILPRTNVGQPNSNIFFAHIGRLESAEEYNAKLKAGNVIYSVDLANQIWASSKIARIKYTLVGNSIRFGIASFSFMATPWLIELAISIFANHLSTPIK